MIPKIIHYCWFGGKKMPELAKKCVKSWKKYLPDYELRLWNEETFNLDMYPFAREAYNAKKYAFVTDIVRLWALEKFGGIYMDTDVEVIRSYDEFLKYPAFTGYEAITSAIYPVTGTMASEAHGVWVKEQLAYYEGRHFLLLDGTYDMTANTIIIADIMKKNGFIIDNTYRVYKNNMHVFPSDYFCPKMWDIDKIVITENTHCIHHFAGSWAPKPPLKFRIKAWINKKVKPVIKKVIGPSLTEMIATQKRKIKNK